MTKRVLFVAYLFPPVGGAGVQRAAKFVKYLPEFGWDVTVLTAENPSVPVFDQSLLADIPSQTQIVRAKTLEPSYALKKSVSASALKAEERGTWMQDASTTVVRRALRIAANVVLQPDPQILWYHHAVDAGLKALAGQKHDAIVVTAPPFSSLLVGAELSRRTGVPLLLDYRDEWDISNAYWENKRQGLWSRWLQRRLQHKVIRAASALVATTRHSAEALATIAATACRGHFKPVSTHIYNGYDAEDMTSVGASLEPVAGVLESNRETFKLAYVGTLWNLTSVEPLIEAAERLCTQAPELASRLELHFAGRRTGPQEELLNRLDNLPCRVIRHPYLDHDAALRLMQSADGLCLLLSDLPHAGRVVPAKLFEYMAIRKPLFAIVPPGETAELLSDCPFAFVNQPSDVSGLTQRLGDAIEQHRMGISVPAGLWNARQFERRTLTGQLAKLLDEVSGQRESHDPADAASKMHTQRLARYASTVEVQ